MSQDSEKGVKSSTLFSKFGIEHLLALALFATLLAIVCLVVSDYREKKALLELEAYKEQWNSEYRITIMCIGGYRYLTGDEASGYAVQVWENGPDGPRPSQCPRQEAAQGKSEDTQTGQ